MTVSHIVMNTLHRAGVCLEAPSIHFADGRIACFDVVSVSNLQIDSSTIRWTNPVELLESGIPLSHLYGQCELEFKSDGDDLVATGGEGTQGDCGFVLLERRRSNASSVFQWLLFLPGLNPIKSISIDSRNQLIGKSTSDVQVQIFVADPLALSLNHF